MSPEDEKKPPRRRRKAGEAAAKPTRKASRPTAKDPQPTGKASKPARKAPKPPTKSTPKRRRRPARRPLGRLGAGETIYFVAAILLLVLMFLDWYGTKPTSGGEPLGGVVAGAGGGTPWDTLEVIPLFLMLAIVVAVGASLLRLTRSTWKPAVPAAAAVCLLGLLAAVLILIRIVSPPGPGNAFSELAFESTLKLPIFLALAAALGIAYGGWRAMGEEGTTFAGIAKRLESPDRPARRKPSA